MDPKFRKGVPMGESTEKLLNRGVVRLWEQAAEDWHRTLDVEDDGMVRCFHVFLGIKQSYL